MADITFRELEEKDLPDRVRWFNQKEVSQYLGSQVRHGTTLEKQKEWFARFMKIDDRKMYVILYDGKPVGNVALTDISKKDRNAGLFIVIGETNHHRRGIGTKATEFILDYGFGELNLHKIWLHVFSPNVGAIKLYEKCGFKVEGRLKEMLKIDGKYHDEIVMAKFNPKEKE